MRAKWQSLAQHTELISPQPGQALPVAVVLGYPSEKAAFQLSFEGREQVVVEETPAAATASIASSVNQWLARLPRCFGLPVPPGSSWLRLGRDDFWRHGCEPVAMCRTPSSFAVTIMLLCALGCSDSSAAKGVSTATDASVAGADATTLADGAEMPDAPIATDASGAVDVSISADTAAAVDILAPVDAAVAPDAGESGLVKTAWGQIDGLCSVAMLELGNPKPQFLVNTYSFDKAVGFDTTSLSAGAKKRFDGPNAGGSSKCSEVMSMQLLFDCAGATVHKTEVEIAYDKKGSITDYILDMKGVKLGVSVTRAYLGPKVTVYSKKDATKT